MILLAPTVVYLYALTALTSAQRIAVIGAGAAGASAAYYAQAELQARDLDPAEIHIFERSNRVGGRAHSGSVVYNNQTFHFEQGASMFIGKNQQLLDLAIKFDLSLCSHPCTFAHTNDVDMEANKASTLGSYGVWEPKDNRWVVRMGSGPFLDSVRMLWRYRGTGDLSYVRRRTQAAVDEFMQSYDDFNNHTAGIFSTWDEYLEDKPLLRTSLYYRAAEFYQSTGEHIGRRFLDEVVSLATRVNYMQDVDRISTIGAHISMAAESDMAYSVAGGNWQIFANMISNAPAHLHLNTTVREIQRSPTGSDRPYALTVLSSDGVEITEQFDLVIIAAPLPLAGIRVLDEQHAKLVAADYVHMYVTFAIGILRDDLFPPGRDLPRLIVTPYHTTDPFNCLSILACLTQHDMQRCRDGPVLVKIFSHAPLDLSRVFSSVEWHHEQQWHSYPQLEPRNAGYANEDDDASTVFRLDRKSPPPIVLDQVGPAAGVFYVNGMETLFSTMESQTVAARHVVRLALFGKGE
ncbi:hypothetical protein H4S04_000410 [Coemansia sp. S16]|nr:hypothetical protein H4S03_001323 [Coemansia sp. S3946]KAJ2053843.1 hypothetical protein H4S04_000410 [Coemansia sp. S16]KAJ2074288.1 hypothetical protein GGH13_001424 [Coemansia sp. S155-1]KAJ2429541.1 hypothetical protein GGF41_001139 [Coemansia sp. RSA 2531]